MRPDPDQLLAQLSALPAGEPLMRRLEGVPGVYLVGGAVRDLLLGGQPFDLDLVVEGDPAGVLARLGGETVTHDRFGTSTATVDGFTYDLARARREAYARPGALPDVTPGTLDEDLERRDFTVNAIALSLGGSDAGQLREFPGALADLDGRRLRVLHDASFVDDPTRLLRLARYRARLGFEVEDRTHALVDQAVGRDAFSTLTGPRIGNELRLLAREQDPITALLALRELGLETAVAPEFGVNDEALARRALELLPADGRKDLLALALAGRRLSGPDAHRLLDRLGFEASDRDVIVAAIGRAEPLASALRAASRPSEIAAAADDAPVELVALAGALGPAAAAREWLEQLRHIALQIDGRDLLAAGVPQGPALGSGLSAALSAKLDGETHSPQDELAVAVQAARAAS